MGGKYSPEHKWEDVDRYVRQQAEATGFRVELKIIFHLSRPSYATIEAYLMPVTAQLLSEAVFVKRGELPLRSNDRAPSAALNLVAQCFYDLEANPWYWSPQMRRKARGEA